MINFLTLALQTFKRLVNSSVLPAYLGQNLQQCKKRNTPGENKDVDECILSLD